MKNNKINRLKASLLLAPALGLGAFGSNAFAAAGDMPTSGTFDVSDAKVAVASTLGIGVAIVLGMTVFKLGKRASAKI